MEQQIIASSITHTLRYFTYEHLPEDLQAVSKGFSELAYKVVKQAPQNYQTVVSLQKLLEAKDAAVRAMLPPIPRTGSNGSEY